MPPQTFWHKRTTDILHNKNMLYNFLYQKLNSETIKLHDIIKQGTVYSFSHTYIQVPVSLNHI